MVFAVHSRFIRWVYKVLCVLVARALLGVLAAVCTPTEVASLLCLDVLENRAWNLKLTATLNVL